MGAAAGRGAARVLARAAGGLSGPVVARHAGAVLAAGSRLTGTGPDPSADLSAPAGPAADSPGGASLGADDGADELDAARRRARKDRKVTAILHTGIPIRYWDHELGVESPAAVPRRAGRAAARPDPGRRRRADRGRLLDQRRRGRRSPPPGATRGPGGAFPRGRGARRRGHRRAHRAGRPAGPGASRARGSPRTAPGSRCCRPPGARTTRRRSSSCGSSRSRAASRRSPSRSATSGRASGSGRPTRRPSTSPATCTAAARCWPSTRPPVRSGGASPPTRRTPRCARRRTVAGSTRCARPSTRRRRPVRLDTAAADQRPVPLPAPAPVAGAARPADRGGHRGRRREPCAAGSACRRRATARPR